MKKSVKFILAIPSAIVLLLLLALSYIHLTNLEVDRQLRLRGFITDRFMDMDIAAGGNGGFTLRACDIVITEERFIETRDGRQMRVLVFRPASRQPNATGFLWIHGGGFRVGAPDLEFDIARQFIQTANTVVVSPQYRLSPQAPFPAAFNDVYDTLLWMKNNASYLGVNPEQLFVGGGSAGGGLAASVALYARDSGDVNIAFLMPLYPMINDMMNTPSAIGNTALVWNSRRNYEAWKLYLGDLFLSRHVPTHAAPARETDFSNLPPTYTFVGDLDPFFCDTIAFVNNLRADGVWVQFDIYRGAFHGFDIIAPNARISREAIGRTLEVFRYATENFFVAQNEH